MSQPPPIRSRKKRRSRDLYESRPPTRHGRRYDVSDTAYELQEEARPPTRHGRRDDDSYDVYKPQQESGVEEEEEDLGELVERTSPVLFEAIPRKVRYRKLMPMEPPATKNQSQIPPLQSSARDRAQQERTNAAADNRKRHRSRDRKREGSNISPLQLAQRRQEQQQVGRWRGDSLAEIQRQKYVGPAKESTNLKAVMSKAPNEAFLSSDDEELSNERGRSRQSAANQRMVCQSSSESPRATPSSPIQRVSDYFKNTGRQLSAKFFPSKSNTKASSPPSPRDNRGTAKGSKRRRKSGSTPTHGQRSGENEQDQSGEQFDPISIEESDDERATDSVENDPPAKSWDYSKQPKSAAMNILHQKYSERNVSPSVEPANSDSRHIDLTKGGDSVDTAHAVASTVRKKSTGKDWTTLSAERLQRVVHEIKESTDKRQKRSPGGTSNFWCNDQTPSKPSPVGGIRGEIDSRTLRALAEDTPDDPTLPVDLLPPRNSPTTIDILHDERIDETRLKKRKTPRPNVQEDGSTIVCDTRKSNVRAIGQETKTTADLASQRMDKQSAVGSSADGNPFLPGDMNTKTDDEISGSSRGRSIHKTTKLGSLTKANNKASASSARLPGRSPSNSFSDVKRMKSKGKAIDPVGSSLLGHERQRRRKSYGSKTQRRPEESNDFRAVSWTVPSVRRSPRLTPDEPTNNERRKRKNRRPETIELLSSDSEVDEEDDKARIIPDLHVDLFRIAIGSKVFSEGCEAMYCTGSTVLKLKFDKTKKKQEEIEVLLAGNFIEAIAYGGKYNFGDDETKPILIVSLNVEMGDEENLKKFAPYYDPNGDDEGHRYIGLEFRQTIDYSVFLASIAYDGDVPNGKVEEIHPSDQDRLHSNPLITAYGKKRRSRKSENNPFVAGRKDDYVLLVYPFGEEKDVIESAAVGLNEASGRLTEVDDCYQSATVDKKPKNSTVHKEQMDDSQQRSHFLTVHVEDYVRLDQGEWLNDTLVDFWMQWISRDDDSLASSNHFFSSHFYTHLEKEGYSGVQSWTKKINIFEKKLVFVPINRNFHWSLLVVLNPGAICTSCEEGNAPLPCLIFLDSLLMHNKKQVANTMRAWLNEVWIEGSKESVHEKPFSAKRCPLFTPNVPKQSNGYDCGVFVCRYASAIYALRKHNFTYEEAGFTPGTRTGKEFYKLITKGSEFKFDMNDISRFRKEFKLLLERLSLLFWQFKRQGKIDHRKSPTPTLSVQENVTAVDGGNEVDIKASPNVAKQVANEETSGNPGQNTSSSSCDQQPGHHDNQISGNEINQLSPVLAPVAAGVGESSQTEVAATNVGPSLPACESDLVFEECNGTIVV